MDERQLSIFERFDQIIVTESNRKNFMVMNTNPLAEFEWDGLEWVPIYPIRYTGRYGNKNVWGL